MTQWLPYIDGRFVSPAVEVKVESVNPTTERVIGSVPECGEREIDAAVSAAREAHRRGDWRRLSAEQRATFLRRIADRVRERADELAQWETADSGKPITDNRSADIPEAASTFEITAELAMQMAGRSIEVPALGVNQKITREPVGVVGSIAPWNFPLVNAAWKIAPAIAAGNAVVFKPSEVTPLTTLLLAQIIDESGLPPGVVNIVTGRGSTTGAMLAAHPDVDQVSFTGSTATGTQVLKGAADHITTAGLELGGKSPNIVLDDCDLELAVEGAAMGAFVNGGQVCTAGSRLLVQASIYEQFIERLIDRTRAFRIGDPTDEQTEMGPMVSAEHRDHVLEYIAIGKQDGGRTLTGGGVPQGMSAGCFVEPTVFDSLPATSRLVREEVFGPVVTVHAFEHDDEAIALANDTEYGLAAGIWSRDPARATAMADQIDAGTVWINTYNVAGAAIPFSGFKRSGIGVENGPEGLEGYTRLKSVLVNRE